MAITTEITIEAKSEAARKLEQLKIDLSRDADVIAAAQEPEFRTTQNSYGYYGSTLSSLAKLMPLGTLGQAASMRFWGDVLIMAGANRQGVQDALHAFS